MKITFIPHALERAEEHGISEEEVHAVLESPDSQGEASFGRLWSQKEIGRRRIRVVYNRGADETVIVTVMLRRKEGAGS